MKHHDPKPTSDDAFEDQPTGKWGVVVGAPISGLESDPKDAEIDPEQMVELPN